MKKRIVDKCAFNAIVAYAKLKINIAEEKDFNQEKNSVMGEWKILKKILLEQIKIIENTKIRENEWLREITTFSMSVVNFLIEGDDLLKTFMLGLAISTNKEDPNEIYGRLVENFRENENYFKELGCNINLQEIEKKFLANNKKKS